MKGKIKVIIITMVVLLIGTGALLWKFNDMSKTIAKQEKERLKEERDLLEDQSGKAIDEVKEVDITPLYMSGDNKNVVTTEFDSVGEIYSAEKSADVEENLTTIKKNKAFSLDNALWAYNPYGTNRNSMYLYFKTNGNSYCRYTVSVKDTKIPDFTRTVIAGASGNLTKEHEFQVLGLVAGETNYITIRVYNSKDELSTVKTFSVKIPGSRVKAPQKLETTDGRSKTTISNGLYVVFQDGKEFTTIKKVTTGKKKKKTQKKKVVTKKYAILLYDNSGVLRGEIPTDGYCGRNIEEIYDTMMYATSETKLSQVNALGQVTKTFSLDGYKQAGEFTYDGYGNVYVIATANGKQATPRSKVIELKLEDGAVTEKVDMDTLLKSVYKKETKGSKKKNVDWVGLNSVQIVGTNEMLLSAKNLSSLIKVSNIGSLIPRIDYIIADKKLYEPYKSLSKKVLKKSAGEEEAEEPEETPVVNNILHKEKKPDPFEAQFGQEAVTYQARSTEGQSYISLLNANTGNGAKANGEAYYYRYLVDETAKTYELRDKTALDQTKKDGNVTAEKDIYIYCCSDGKYFVEGDWNDRMIRRFNLEKRPYRVYKKDFKGFWFY